MKSPSSNDIVSGSLPVWQRNLSSEQPHQSLFSLLLEMENRLHAEARDDSLLQAKQRKLAQGKNYNRPEHLSRYIE